MKDSFKYFFTSAIIVSTNFVTLNQLLTAFILTATFVYWIQKM